MNTKIKIYWAILLIAISGSSALAGNPDRIGEAGATQLVVNPWGRSAGWAGANTAGISGVEAMRFNVAGLVMAQGNEVVFARTAWFQSGDININAFALKTKLGDYSALGISIMSYDMGDFVRTTTENPDGTLGTFSPSYSNIGLSYAYAFSEATSGGITIRMVNEAIPDVNSSGIAIDAGIQYRAGLNNRFKLGFSLRNVGPSMRFSGNGLDFRAIPEDDAQGISKTVQSRSSAFELPTILNIGVAYDFFLDETQEDYILTLAGNFVANSFGRDDIQAGAEFNLKNILLLRAGFSYQQGITDPAQSTTLYAGPSAGFTVQTPLSKGSEKLFGLDYAYRTAQVVPGAIHTVGVKVTF